MSSRPLAISVRGLGKAYRLGLHARNTTLAEAVTDRCRNPLQKSASPTTFWALEDLDFDVRRGDVVGIIGRNGAGKSTLLKVLTRITSPTTGQVRLFGRVGSLLEVGTGFHGELTGRENIFLNGAILGMRRHEIRKRFDEIVAFAGVEMFLDTPVKRYSSGMYVRLAFAVAAHLETDILIVDEVLAVGDIEFQNRCLGKMSEIAGSDRCVLFVSHNLQSIRQLCSRGIVLNGGRLAHAGTSEQAIAAYLAETESLGDAPGDIDARPGSGEYRFVEVAPSKAIYDGNEQKEISFRVERRNGELARLFLSAQVFDASGAMLAQFDSRLNEVMLGDSATIEGQFAFDQPWLKPGKYRVDMYVLTLAVNQIVDHFEASCYLQISPLLPYPGVVPAGAIQAGLVLPSFAWNIDSGRVLKTVYQANAFTIEN